MRIARNTIIISLMLLSVSVTAYGQDVVTRKRVCSVCKQNKPVSAFSGDSKTCKTCVKNAEERRQKEIARQAERERIAKEQAEKERIAREEAERKRIAQLEEKRKEQERLARIKAEEECPYVDLGLPSRTLWAKCNVGANKPEEYGDYFAWGETKGYKSGKTVFDWDTYKWGTIAIRRVKKGSQEDNESPQVKKYCIRFWGNPDGKSILDLEDDAAYINWGNKWCMPSKEQFEELLKQCTWTPTTFNGVRGFMVKGKNGKTLFLPSAGVATPTSIRWFNVGYEGYYWSKSLSGNELCAYNLFFSNSNIKKEVNYQGREYGMPIRPVRMK